MNLSIPKEKTENETRVALTPDDAKKLIKQGLKITIESGAGQLAGFPDSLYTKEGAALAPDTAGAFKGDIVLKIAKPTLDEVELLKPGALLLSQLDPFGSSELIDKLATKNVNTLCLELIPRTSRAQSMDVLSSQANIAGYRAVLEAAAHYKRFFPMMMTSAGMAKPAKVLVIGAGVAGLQAIATAKRLGSQVEAFDIRPEVKEQILSLGAKFLELNLNEEGTGQGGYAKELSEDGKRKQLEALGEKIKKFDVVISTANIPGRKAPLLISEDAVKGMRAGSVILDMAAASGGNCALTKAGQIISQYDVTIIGPLNLPALVPADASAFFSRNCLNLLALVLQTKDQNTQLNYNLEDDIIAASLVTYNGKRRWPAQGERK